MQPVSPDEVRLLARDFLRGTGINPADFARMCGYRYCTMSQFLTGKYRRGLGSKEDAISEAILRVVSSHAESSPDQFTGKLYEIGNTRTMRDLFRRLAERPCILLAYAPPGSGKTDVARALMPEFRSEHTAFFRVYCRAAISPRDLMQRVAQACGSITGIRIERIISNLRYDYAGRRVVLYFDEAQHLSVDCLETVRELYDELRWSLCFAGSHQLDKIFTKWAGDLEQLERRITDKVTIPPVTGDEAEGIVRSELPDLSAAKARRLIERSHVEIKRGGETQRFLSIGRVMANVRELQGLMAAEEMQPNSLSNIPGDDRSTSSPRLEVVNG